MKLILSKELFEYEIRGLLMAYFPGQKFVTDPESTDPEGLYVTYEGEEPCLTVKLRFEHEGTASTAETEIDLTKRKAAKTEVKNMLYHLLRAANGRPLPWGTLTGIRPTKIPMALLREGVSEPEILSELTGGLLLSEEKAALSIDIAKRELALLQKVDDENGYSLYIGIPFCPSICLYCSFSSFPLGKYEKRVWDYLYALDRELQYVAEAFREQTLNTVYFGGGTPTTLSPEQLDFLLTRVENYFDLSHVLEWTVEAGRPDSITREKLEVLKKHPVTRISINPQTLKQKTLDLVGRRHTVEDVLNAYHMAREMGFTNINMDLIFGLPGETEEDIRSTIREITELAPDNVTIHSLALKRAAELNIMKDAYKCFRMDNSDDLMQEAADRLSEIGLQPYYLYRQKNMAGNQENVGYAAPGKEGAYNILIMEETESIVACGAGAVTKRVFPDGRIERCENVKDVNTYIERIEEMIERKKDLFSE